MLFRIILTISIVWTSNCLAFQKDMRGPYDYALFYQAFKTEDTVLFNRELQYLSNYSGIERDAFYGALLMKKSKSLPTIKRKLDSFRNGRDLLENSIKEDPQNLEFRFLRLATQENAPAFLNYYDKKNEDAAFISAAFDRVPVVAKKYIIEYAQLSETLKPEDLK